MAAATDLRASLADLVKHRAGLEELLIELIAVGEHATRVRRAKQSETKLHRAADRIGKLIGAIEDRIARVNAPTLRDAILKLEVYADCQGYHLGAGRRRGARSFDERLFRSIVDDVRRIEAGSSNHRIATFQRSGPWY